MNQCVVDGNEWYLHCLAARFANSWNSYMSALDPGLSLAVRRSAQRPQPDGAQLVGSGELTINAIVQNFSMSDTVVGGEKFGPGRNFRYACTRSSTQRSKTSDGSAQ